MERAVADKKAIVLGAGVTGLATGWRLARNGYQVTVIEKAGQVGGLAGTIDWDGWKFDFGAHSFHTRHPEITALYKELLGDRFLHLEDLATKIFIFGKLVNYPLVGAHILTVLDTPTMVRAGADFLFTRLKSLVRGIEPTDRLDEWIIRRFGTVLYKVYFAHYIERIQKTDPRLLSSDLGAKKIPIFSIRQYLLREITKSRKRHPEDVMTLEYYYARDGYGQLSECFHRRILELGGRVNVGESLVQAEVEKREVVGLRTDRAYYDCRGCDVVSTIPLGSLINSVRDCDPGVARAADSLRTAQMRFLLMKVDKPKVMGYRWVNFSDLKFPFYRVSESVSDVFNMVPENKCSLVFEVPVNEGDALWRMDDESLADLIIPLFGEAFELARRDVIAVKSLFASHATPIMSLEYRASLRSVFDYLGNVANLHSLGRQGMFTYVNVDGCTKMALEFADSLVRGEAKEHSRDLLRAVHGI